MWLSTKHHSAAIPPSSWMEGLRTLTSAEGYHLKLGRRRGLATTVIKSRLVRHQYHRPHHTEAALQHISCDYERTHMVGQDQQDVPFRTFLYELRLLRDRRPGPHYRCHRTWLVVVKQVDGQHIIGQTVYLFWFRRVFAIRAGHGEDSAQFFTDSSTAEEMRLGRPETERYFADWKILLL